MANSQSPNFTEMLRKALEQRIREEIGAEFEEQKKEIIKRLDEKKDEILAGVTLHMMKKIEITTANDRLIVELKTEPLK